MHDIKLVRDDPQAFDAALAKRGLEPLSSMLLSLDEERRRHIAELQAIQERRNAASKEVGQAKASRDEERAKALIEEVGKLKGALQDGEEKTRILDARLHDALGQIPNLPVDEVPVGPDESANREVKRNGNIRNFAFSPKQHFETGEELGQMDFETAAKLSGARFVVLKGDLARLDRALGNFMLDMHANEFGYTEVQPPLLMRTDAMFGTAQLPKFAEDQFETTDGRWLIPTAEVPLTNLVRESILEEDILPLRFTAWTPCFRSEAGSAGRDTRGMIRQHQFSKVELVSITTPEQSADEHERMVSAAEEVLKRLEIPYRVMLLSSGDMGFASQKTYDIEVWLPGQGAYREISSLSVCGDFQARRMNARYRPKDAKGTRFVHTLNGSGLAIGRTLVAVLENFQEADGSVTIPPALVPYMGGRNRIERTV